MEQELVIISVGGSLIVPKGNDGMPDVEFLRNFKKFIITNVERGKKFICIAGGGQLTRKYQEVQESVTETTPEDRDWVGIHATRLNGELLKNILKGYADTFLVTNTDILPVTDKPVIVGAGYKPGCSTDFRAVQIAKKLHIKKVVNLSNIDYAYTDDPRTNPNAEKIERMSWDDFLKLIPAEWTAGLNSPFDPVASREAKEHGIEVAIINGNKLEEVEKYLSGEPFIGSVIK